MNIKSNCKVDLPNFFSQNFGWLLYCELPELKKIRINKEDH